MIRQLDRQTHLDEVCHTSFRMDQAFPPWTYSRQARSFQPTDSHCLSRLSHTRKQRLMTAERASRTVHLAKFNFDNVLITAHVDHAENSKTLPDTAKFDARTDAYTSSTPKCSLRSCFIPCIHRSNCRLRQSQFGRFSKHSTI